MFLVFQGNFVNLQFTIGHILVAKKNVEINLKLSKILEESWQILLVNQITLQKQSKDE